MPSGQVGPLPQLQARLPSPLVAEARAARALIKHTTIVGGHTQIPGQSRGPVGARMQLGAHRRAADPRSDL